MTGEDTVAMINQHAASVLGLSARAGSQQGYQLDRLVGIIRHLFSLDA